MVFVGENSELYVFGGKRLWRCVIGEVAFEIEIFAAEGESFDHEKVVKPLLIRRNAGPEVARIHAEDDGTGASLPQDPLSFAKKVDHLKRIGKGQSAEVHDVGIGYLMILKRSALDDGERPQHVLEIEIDQGCAPIECWIIDGVEPKNFHVDLVLSGIEGVPEIEDLFQVHIAPVSNH